MSLTATAVILSPRPNPFRRRSSVSSNRNWSEQTQDERSRHRRQHPEMSSAAYYGQRPMVYATGGSSRDFRSSISGPIGRSWPPTKDAQAWPEDYHSHSQQEQAQQQQRQQHQAPTQHARQSVSHTMPYPVTRQSTRHSTPNSTHSSYQASAVSTSADSQSMVTHSLQIPSRISKSGGNLADFSAQLTCLFWFESPQVLEAAERVRKDPEDRSLPRLSPNALPTEPFRKWVRSVLSTTQVTQNVILLALMFVYRLKMTNLSVRGRPGSEYRLLTVALMLGNKFLDDNTYTNKTWAEVSGISVKEIHVMEVEFLSNMRYALLASSEQWDEWLEKLSSYHVFCERVANGESSPTLMIPSPTANEGFSPITSPTAYHSTQSTSRSTSGGATYSPPSLPANPAMYSGTTGGAYPSLAPRPELVNDFGRKRMFEWHEQSAEPPAKKAYLGPAASSVPKPAPDARRLPVPSLTLNTGTPTAATQAAYPVANYSIPQPQAAPYTVSLPPLEPGMRAMSAVYAPPTTSTWPPVSTASSSAARQHNVAPPAALMTPTSQYPSVSNTAYGAPTKRLSPTNNLSTAAAYNASSPLHDYSQNSGFHTPISNSPSLYLQQRNSPYKPIRNVRTLLNPPPSSSLQGYQLPAIPPSQMHYQPIGRRNDQRTGIVPEYRNNDNYGSSSQFGGNSHYGGNPQYGGPQNSANPQHGARPSLSVPHRYANLMN